MCCSLEMEWNNTANSCDDFDKCAENLSVVIQSVTTPISGSPVVEMMSAVQFHINGVELDKAFDALFETDEYTELENVCGEQECKLI